MNYFWNFPFNIFELQLTQVTETMESEIIDKVGGRYYKNISRGESGNIKNLSNEHFPWPSNYTSVTLL